MKSTLKYLCIAITSSIVTTIFLHVYVYHKFKKPQSYQIKKIITPINLENEKLTLQKFKLETNWKDTVYYVTPSDIEHHPTYADNNTIQSTITHSEETEKNEKTFPEPTGYCEEFPSELKGPLIVNSTYYPTVDEATRAAGNDVIDGCFRPSNCISNQKVAVVIPYKNRFLHLVTLLRHLHPLLQRQKIAYCIFIAEQFDDGVFNKARVMNAAFVEITKKLSGHRDPTSRPFDCFIFHDVDMLPENDHNLYKCSNSPKHMSPAIDKFNYTTDYGTKYGGVTAIRTDHYEMVNGHSNRFWGWGGEDNDMEERIFSKNLTISVVNDTIGRFKMIEHQHPWWFDPASGVGSYYRISSIKYKMGWRKKAVLKKDYSGVSDIKFTLVETQRHHLWTKLVLDIRDHIVEKVKLQISGYEDSDIEVYSVDLLNSPEKRNKNNKTKNPSEDECEPTYHKFLYMTVNRTTGFKDEYTKVYFSLEDAKKQCNLMKTFCQSIVEKMRGRYTLRSTAFVQENKLVYKHGLSEQYDVTEIHRSSSVHVKICKNNSAYTQFFLPPIILYGTPKTGSAPRYRQEFTLRIYHPSSSHYTLNTHILSTHRGVMEEKVQNGVIPQTWWDSLSHIQYGRFKVINMSNEVVIKKHTIEQDERSSLVTIRIPFTPLRRRTGCFLMRNQLLDEATGKSALEWVWWFQIRAKNEEMEEAFVRDNIDKSLKASEEFNKMMENRKFVLERFAVEKKNKFERRNQNNYIRGKKEAK